MAAIKKVKVPFDKDGNMLHKDRGNAAQYSEVDAPFREHMTFKSIQRWSSNVVIFENGVGNTFYMSQGEFENNIKYMVRGVLEGRFYFHKQGQYFSLKYIPDAVI
jgi:hypothetical protein